LPRLLRVNTPQHELTDAIQRRTAAASAIHVPEPQVAVTCPSVAFLTFERTTGTKITSMRNTIVVNTAARRVAPSVRPVPRCGRVMREGRAQRAKSESVNARNVNPHATG